MRPEDKDLIYGFFRIQGKNFKSEKGNS